MDKISELFDIWSWEYFTRSRNLYRAKEPAYHYIRNNRELNSHEVVAGIWLTINRVILPSADIKEYLRCIR